MHNHDEQSIAVIRHFLTLFFTQPAQLKDCCASGVVLYWREKPLVSGLEALTSFARAQQRCFPDIEFKLKDYIATADKVAVRLVQSGYLQAEWEGLNNIGAPFAVSETMFFHLKQCLITHIWPVLDIEDKRQQIMAYTD